MTKLQPTTTAITKLDNSLAQLLDNKFVIPGTSFRIGLDALIGLIPGVGDILMGIISLYFVLRAIQERMKWTSVIAMILRVLFEMLIGTIPVLGDLFDIWYKANTRNNNVLQKHITASRDGKPITIIF